jgi:HK97 family phage major capsid protein
MPPVIDDLRTEKDVREALKAKRAKAAEIREANGGTFVGLTGTTADEVRELMAETNLLGGRLEELSAQAQSDAEIDKINAYFDEPAVAHPGHAGTKGYKPREKGPQDIGALFIESDAFKAYKEQGTKDKVVTLPMGAVFKGYQGIGEVPSMDRQAALFQTSGYPIQPEFLPDPIPTLFQPNNIGQLMAQGTTSLPTVRYVTETVTAQGAAETAEGATKPEAQISFTNVDEPVRKIAVTLPLTDESFDDVPLLRAYLNARLRLFLQMREDSQLLLGNGTPPNLQGILNRSGINTATSYSIGGANPDQALVDATFHGAMRVRDAFLEPDAVVLKPSTWEIAALAKDGNRNYLLGGPGAAGYAGNDPVTGPRIWGLRVVLNANMPAQVATNKVALIGAFAASAMLIRRSGIDVAISDSHSTFFQENKIMLRVEERVALAVFRPAGFAAVTSAA